jgi:signal transduction histidine kinase
MRAAVEIALQKPRGTEEYRSILATLGEQCERLTALVNGLLLLARADAGEIAIRREAVDLAALASDVAEMFDPLAEERGIRLMVEASGSATVAGDPSRLRQLVTNLVDNAVRFTEPGGEVALRVDGEAARAILRVTRILGSASRRSTCRTSSSGSIRRTPPAVPAAVGSA